MTNTEDNRAVLNLNGGQGGTMLLLEMNFQSPRNWCR